MAQIKRWFERYGHPLVRDIVGKRFRMIRPYANGFMGCPEGTVVTVRNSHLWSALSFTAAPCPHCGNYARGRIPASYLEPVEGPTER